MELLDFLDEAAFADREEGKRMILHQADMLSEMVTASDHATYAEKWTGFSAKEREDLFLDILSRSQETSEMQHSNSITSRINCPEFSLDEMTGGDGSGYFRLVDALMTEGRIVDGEADLRTKRRMGEEVRIQPRRRDPSTPLQGLSSVSGGDEAATAFQATRGLRRCSAISRESLRLGPRYESLSFSLTA